MANLHKLPTQSMGGEPYHRHIGALVAVTGLVCVLLASACGQTSTFAKPPAPATAEAHPVGSPVPAQLQGDWLMPALAANTLASGACPKPLAVATCTFTLRFTASTYNWTTNVPGFGGGGGDAVVNGTEIDFFNGAACVLTAPEGIGRYTWTVIGASLHFVSLNVDPCPRSPWLANQSYTRSGT
jgi:hypothetical protein